MMLRREDVRPPTLREMATEALAIAVFNAAAAVWLTLAPH